MSAEVSKFNLLIVQRFTKLDKFVGFYFRGTRLSIRTASNRMLAAFSNAIFAVFIMIFNKGAVLTSNR